MNELQISIQIVCSSVNTFCVLICNQFLNNLDMAKAKPRTIRLDENIDKALDAYVEALKQSDSKANHNSVINEFCGDRLIAKKSSIENRVELLEIKVADIEKRLDAD